MGLRKFALDPVVVIFFKKCQKNYKCWIKWISKKFTTIGSANTCNFFWKWKKIDFKKKYNYGILVVLWSHSCNFFWNQIFSFSKKITSVGSANTCKFFDIFKKNYKCWIKCKLSKCWINLNFLSPNGQGYKKTWSSRCNFFQKTSKNLQVLDQVHFKKIYNDWISQHL